MSITDETLQLLRCPETGSELVPVSEEIVQQINQCIQQGKLVDRIGKSIQEPIDGALVNQQKTWMYPIRGGIVIMITDQAISASAVERCNE